ncbi:hypothetical protein MUA26_03810 [Staphylococcus sp. IVB6246]|uniref:hypothetical protein n=1 Tax=Staphylococcus sp. IVB6246 TaxID=2989772 RepID=UPI0021CF3FAA|nr:hypothetical protein [Staphylococcus sp. IVB6246]UXR70266.1 hypothetical protein MUA26_03810 [Staphylococcus sp. IVB6246]
MGVIAICVSIFSFVLTALKYYLDYMKDTLNIEVVPTRSSTYLQADKSSYNDMTFVNFTKFPISIIDVEFDIENTIGERKTFKIVPYENKNYSMPFTLGPYESLECKFLLDEYSVIWQWDVTIRVITNKGTYTKPVVIESLREFREPKQLVTEITSINKVSALSNPKGGFLKKFLHHLKT